MKKTNNQKGMTLVEVIVAMAIFSVVTTGFCMTASYCIKAQAKARTRLTEINNQTTTVEDFTGMVAGSTEGATEGANAIQKIDPSTDKWTISFPMKKETTDTLGNTVVVEAYDSDGNPWSDTLENNNVEGYRMDTVAGEVYQLTFFSSDSAIALDTSVGASGEYWIKVYNYSPDEQFYSFETDTGAKFFDNAKQSHVPFTSTSTVLLDSFGEDDTVAKYIAVGVKGDNPNVRIIDWGTLSVVKEFKPLDYEVAAGTHMCELYIGPDGNFYNQEDFNDNFGTGGGI